MAELEKDEEFIRCGWGFSLLGFSTFGGLGPSGAQLIRQLVEQATADKSGWEKTRAVAEFRQTVNFALVVQVGRQLLLKQCVQDTLSFGEDV